MKKYTELPCVFFLLHLTEGIGGRGIICVLINIILNSMGIDMPENVHTNDELLHAEEMRSGDVDGNDDFENTNKIIDQQYIDELLKKLNESPDTIHPAGFYVVNTCGVEIGDSTIAHPNGGLLGESGEYVPTTDELRGHNPAKIKTIREAVIELCRQGREKTWRYSDSGRWHTVQTGLADVMSPSQELVWKAPENEGLDSKS
jgi:hypothetical protein